LLLVMTKTMQEICNNSYNVALALVIPIQEWVLYLTLAHIFRRRPYHSVYSGHRQQVVQI
jgi:hypothetical protein